VRIVGVELPNQKRVEASLPYLYGIGKTLAKKILNDTRINPDKRAKDLTEEEFARLQKEVEKYKIEGDARREIQQNIKRLQEIGAYRGLRHLRNLPARGQRTRTNARTKRGKRQTIGTVRKDITAKMGTKSQPGQKT
jgi:small subunit ribosomal protein S13